MAEPFIVPEGWELVTKVNSNGSVVKYFTNVLGQKFYSEEDLLRNIRDAKARGLSIYAPDFNTLSLGASSSQRKKQEFCAPSLGASSSQCKKKQEFGASSFGAFSSQSKKKQEFGAPSFGASSSQRKKKSKVGEASTGVCKKKKQSSSVRGEKEATKEKEIEQKHEMQGVKTGSHISDQSDETEATGTSKFRTSRRVAGLKPELIPDFDFSKPLEYIIKDKPQV